MAPRIARIALPPVSPNAPGLSWAIDWSDLKSIALSLLNGESNAPKLRKVNFNASDGLRNPDSWHGFTRGNVERWLREGFESPAFSSLSESAPVRSRRKRTFHEDGDELSIDAALSGEEFFMIRTERPETLPGVSLDCVLSFSSTTDASVINAYNAWICKTVYSLERSGIDPVVTLTIKCENLFVESRGLAETSIRVKREGETANFQSFSPMLSPAAFRGFGFMALGLHAESRGYSVAPGLGRPLSTQFGVSFDRDSQTIQVACEGRGATSFPETRMDSEFLSALHDSRLVA